ncbi:hypothetical protein HW555_000788 [Spodoptera exigua]|uniref:Uncharacterized protein n=1 Tax=Spodoptera exigua TaxID=7107 RepID=A0A835GSS3_SPOEX|nr:hypothetical protein HW555_000788 [Spodoptera exigua]
MKLPFNQVLAPILKPYLGRTRLFCRHPTFCMSIFYTYLYGVLGFHLGELPPACSTDAEERDENFMLHHDLKIIATSMGLVQYACLLVGCFTENPSLFIPHLAGQLVMVAVKILNALLLFVPINAKAIGKLSHKIPAIILMSFNWLQEFCVFRKYLCICDL